MAPLGLPVVPEVYKITAQSSSCTCAASTGAPCKLAKAIAPSASPTAMRKRHAGASSIEAIRSANSASNTTALAVH